MELLHKVLNKLGTTVSPPRKLLVEYKPECAACDDLGWIVEEGKGAVQCGCLRARVLERALSNIPRIYRKFCLATIKPRVDLHAKQPEIITAITEQPQSSFLFFGRPGSGKSLMGWMLYRDAVERGRCAIGASCADLLTQIRRWEFDADNVPAITAGDLRQSARRYLVFLDELDKARPTEYAGEQLHMLTDAAYSFGHQLVITSNLNPDDLRFHWSRENATYGNAILRRLFELDDAIEIDMY